jgi:MFS family permease
MTYALEVLPYSLRAKGMSIYMFTLMSAITFNILVNPIALEAIAWKYYFVFLTVLAVSFVAMYFVFPETSSRLLEDVAVIFDGEDALTAPEVHLDNEERNDSRNEKDIKEAIGHNELKASPV